jgi:hypothetical protein
LLRKRKKNAMRFSAFSPAQHVVSSPTTSQMT